MRWNPAGRRQRKQESEGGGSLLFGLPGLIRKDSSDRKDEAHGDISFPRMKLWGGHTV